MTRLLRRHLGTTLVLTLLLMAAGGTPHAALATVAAAPSAQWHVSGDYLPVVSAPLAQRATGLPVTAPSYLLADLTSGQVLAERQADLSRSPASITKVMTALVAIERGDLNDVVTVSERAANTAGTSAGLVAGQLVSLRSLLYGLMLESGNDAAVAIAEHLAGSEAGFAEVMNRRARELGARGTNFRTASGLDGRRGEGVAHVTTARDMAAFARRAMDSAFFREVVTTPEYSLGGYTLHNLNYFLFGYPGATGIKSGWTPRAGNTLVASARRGSVELLAVLMGSEGRDALYDDAFVLMDFGFRAYRYFPVLRAGEVVFPIYFSRTTTPLLAAAARDAAVHWPPGAWPFRVEREIELAPGVTPATHIGSVVGYVNITTGGRVVDRVPLLAAGRQAPPVQGFPD